MDLFRSTWCSLLALWSNSKRITIKYWSSNRWTYQCSYRMKTEISFSIFLHWLLLGWKRFSETCDTLFSITSIITVMPKFWTWKFSVDGTTFRKAREILLSEFDRYASLGQDFLGDDQRIERFLRLVPDDNILCFLFVAIISLFTIETFLNDTNL